MRRAGTKGRVTPSSRVRSCTENASTAKTPTDASTRARAREEADQRRPEARTRHRLVFDLAHRANVVHGFIAIDSAPRPP